MLSLPLHIDNGPRSGSHSPRGWTTTSCSPPAPFACRGHLRPTLLAVTVLTPYTLSAAVNSATTSAGLNGGRRSHKQSSSVVPKAVRCAIARVMPSCEPPLGSTNAKYRVPATGGSSRRPDITTAATASRLTKPSMSRRNSAPYSAAAATSSATYASAMSCGSTAGFTLRVSACHTSTGSPSWPSCRRYASQRAPRLRDPQLDRGRRHHHRLRRHAAERPHCLKRPSP